MFFLDLLGGFDFAKTFAMALLLTCKSKTWGPYCCGCCCKVLCIRLVYDMEGMVYGFVAIALFHICMIKSRFNICARSCDKTTTLTISDNVALLRGTHFSSAALQEVWSCGVLRCGLSIQQRLRAISMGSVSYLLLRRTLSMGSASHLLLRPTKMK